MRLLIIMILSLALWGCRNPKDNETASEIDNLKSDSIKADPFDYNNPFKLENYLVSESSSDTSVVQTVDTDCVILIRPTPELIEEIKKTEEEDVDPDTNDLYMAQASQVIDSVGVEINTAHKQFVKFVGDQKSWTIDIRKQNDLLGWHLVFFKRNKPPEIIDAPRVNKKEIKMVIDYFEESIK